MYRYSVDNAVTYTSEDIVLFRESPFACWMERLTLENPDHGIPPDLGSRPPENYMQRQDELAETLRAEDKHVRLVDWDAPESARRNATLEAMRQGTDFIVNGQLALGPLSGSANLLMRTSGYSELGNYLYIPCDTQAKTTMNSAFRLCFLADLLHSLQGQLPPQMLIIRGGSDLLPLETEDHIYHYRAVKQRFMQTMREFRKHRMPDPAESAQFGRWSECANEVMKQRALRSDEAPEKLPKEQADEEQAEQEQALPLQVAGGAQPQAVAPESQDPRQGSKGIPVGDTLAVQARKLPTMAPQEGGSAGSAQPATKSGGSSSVMDVALQNLEFIGSSGRAPTIGEPMVAIPEPESEAPAVEPDPEPAGAVTPAQAPDYAAKAEPTRVFDGAVDVADEQRRAHPLDSSGIFAEMGGTESKPSVETPPPVLHTDSHEFEVDCVDDSDYGLPAGFDEEDFALVDEVVTGETAVPPELEPEVAEEDDPEPKINRPFSSSLNTSGFQDD